MDWDGGLNPAATMGTLERTTTSSRVSSPLPPPPPKIVSHPSRHIRGYAPKSPSPLRATNFTNAANNVLCCMRAKVLLRAFRPRPLELLLHAAAADDYSLLSAVEIGGGAG